MMFIDSLYTRATSCIAILKLATTFRITSYNVCYTKLLRATEYYAPEWERTIIWNDPEIGIDWPLLPGLEPLLSDKDQKGKLLAEAELFD